MPIIKVSEATPPQLNYLVAKCVARVHENEILDGRTMHGLWISGLFLDPNYWIRTDEFNPSTQWSHGGPIIERERIETRHDGRSSWCAWMRDVGAAFGPTLLTAAMRCFVTSKMGETAEIPEELELC